MEDIGHKVGEYNRIGHIPAGDSIRFYITSDNPGVEGDKLYGEPYSIEDDHYDYRIKFEDWTDLTFTDLWVDVGTGPMPNEPNEIIIDPLPYNIMYGETAYIYFEGERRDGYHAAFPEDQQFDVWIDEDYQDWGTLVSRDGSQRGVHLSNVQQPVLFISATAEELGIEPGFASPDLHAKAVLQDPYPPLPVSGRGEVRFRPERLKVGFETNPVAPGNSTVVTPFFQYRDGERQQFDKDHQFWLVRIIKGNEYGHLESVEGEDLGPSENYVVPGFKFVANDNIDRDSADVWLEVATDMVYDRPLNPKSKATASQVRFSPTTSSVEDSVALKHLPSYRQELIDLLRAKGRDGAAADLQGVDPTFGKPAANKGKMMAATISTTSHNTAFEVGYGRLLIAGKQQEELMLGETKYYAAVRENPGDKIKIKQIKAGSSGSPDAPDGLVAGAFGNHPIEVLSPGNKSGVYWSRKWAVINGDGTIDQGDLPAGMIRVIGRYWQADKNYKVKLKATDGGSSASLKISVVKPKHLGDKYQEARDVFNHKVNMDSLIIANAGIYGIPPQIVKGQIDKESAKINFEGDVGWGFAPSYRFEPYYKDPYENIWFKEWAGKYYFKDLESANLNSIPHHLNLNRDYFRKAKTVWEIIKTNSQLKTQAGAKIYGQRTATGKMDYGKYESIQDLYDSFYSKVKQDTSLTNIQIADSTNELMSVYLRDKWEGGMKNNVAQTRAASSYGLLQPMYTTAREKGYPKGNRPEDINLIKSFPYFVKDQGRMINEEVGNMEGNWSNGYEKTIRDIVLAPWNDDPNYPKAVLKLTKKYPPK